MPNTSAERRDGEDYDAKPAVAVKVRMNGAVVWRYALDIRLDVDDDGISDMWERERINDWHMFGEFETESIHFFAACEDKENEDPDQPQPNIGMPPHKTEGDSLTVLQEYRGFILDGGAGHTGGHKRLSASKKELLVEVDIMAGVTNMPSEAGIRGIMDALSSGFGHLTDRAGINLYYVIDETAATHVVFASDDAWDDWMDDHRHQTDGDDNMLTEFVYLSFVDSYSHRPNTLGLTGTCGASTGVDAIHTAMPVGTPFSDALAHTTAHELTHLIIDTNSANGFDSGEHLDDPNGNGIVGDNNDRIYLMSNHRTWAERVNIVFSNLTRLQMDLINKDSV